MTNLNWLQLEMSLCYCEIISEAVYILYFKHMCTYVCVFKFEDEVTICAVATFWTPLEREILICNQWWYWDTSIQRFLRLNVEFYTYQHNVHCTKYKTVFYGQPLYMCFYTLSVISLNRRPNVYKIDVQYIKLIWKLIFVVDNKCNFTSYLNQLHVKSRQSIVILQI